MRKASSNTLVHLAARALLLSLLSLLAPVGCGRQEEDEVLPPDGEAAVLEPELTALEGGQWTSPPGNGMQAVHASLLPNGKVLVINGSSNRDGIDTNQYNQVDNTALFNPSTPTAPWTRLPSSVTPGVNGPNIDRSHMHTSAGNLLFIGGTEQYDPFLGGQAGNSVQLEDKHLDQGSASRTVGMGRDGTRPPALTPRPP